LTEVVGPVRVFDRLHDALAAFAELKDPSQSLSGETSL
jgi:hypothetical protein